MKSSTQQQQQQQQPQQPTDSRQEPQQPQQQHLQSQVAPGALVGSFKGSASQTRPIPPHVLDQEYYIVHQVGSCLFWCCLLTCMHQSLSPLVPDRQPSRSAC